MEGGRRKEMARRLVEWFEESGRSFPWRRDGLKPYDALIAEMMLQRTRAAMVAKAYSSFLERFPDPRSLGSASVEEIGQVLKPLGLYNRRARWMKTVAQVLLKRYDGLVPKRREALLELPGIGMYNANAVLCFAYDEPLPLIDVNVARVLGRVAGIDVSGDLRRNEKLYKLASQLVPEKDFKRFNWALLDLGATLCTPKDPTCNKCPLLTLCNYAGSAKSSKGEARDVFREAGGAS